MRPIKDRGLAITTHHRTHKAAMLGDRFDLAPGIPQHASIGDKRLIRGVGRTVKKVEIVAEALPSRANMQRGTARLDSTGQHLTIIILGYPAGNQGVYELEAAPIAPAAATLAPAIAAPRPAPRPAPRKKRRR